MGDNFYYSDSNFDSIRFDDDDDASLGSELGTGQILVCPLFLKNEKSNCDAVIRRQLVNALFPHFTSTAMGMPRVNWTAMPTSPCVGVHYGQ